jgi:hypothetical protein
VNIWAQYGCKWRRLHNEELLSLCYSANIVRMIKSKRLRWESYVTRMEEGRSTFKILTGKPTGRLTHKWENNIRMDHEEIGISSRNWDVSAQDMDYWRALVNVALNLWVP